MNKRLNLHFLVCDYQNNYVPEVVSVECLHTLAEVSTAAIVAFFPRSICTDIFALLKSNPELCNAFVRVSSNLS